MELPSIKDKFISINSSNDSISKKWVNAKDVSIGSTFVNNSSENENSWAKFLFGYSKTF